MAIYPFSTQDKKRPQDRELVESIKEYCDKNKLNFSLVVVEALKHYKKEHIDGR